MKTSYPHTTGIGFDSHAFSKKGTLVLGGLRFPGTPALAGHSDGDAMLHAIIDALLGAASMGDIGTLFPDTAVEYKGISSRILVRETLKKVKSKGYEPIHIDVTIVAERPKLAPVREELKQFLARIVKLPLSSLNVKGKRPEGLTWFGPKGGVAVWAVATVRKTK